MFCLTGGGGGQTDRRRVPTAGRVWVEPGPPRPWPAVASCLGSVLNCRPAARPAERSACDAANAEHRADSSSERNRRRYRRLAPLLALASTEERHEPSRAVTKRHGPSRSVTVPARLRVTVGVTLCDAPPRRPGPVADGQFCGRHWQRRPAEGWPTEPSGTASGYYTPLEPRPGAVRSGRPR